jgi:hypothetical protein
MGVSRISRPLLDGGQNTLFRSLYLIPMLQFPSNSLFPVESDAAKLHVHAHKPIDGEGKTEDELADLVRACSLKTLPVEQHPLELSNENEPALPNN